MRILVPGERTAGERRVAATPDTVAQLVVLGASVAIERGAGAAARFPDAAYEAAGAQLVDSADPSGAALVLRVAPPTVEEVRAMDRGSVLIGYAAPHRNLDMVRALADAGVTALAMELVPRISRAQSMDALSSQANLAGYRAVLTAAAEVDKYFPLLMTAAGTVRPAEVVVLGAGVAGLQALATARRLGANIQRGAFKPLVPPLLVPQDWRRPLTAALVSKPVQHVSQGRGAGSVKAQAASRGTALSITTA
jgi:NAD(P) transhydrogenase subunit alpha